MSTLHDVIARDLAHGKKKEAVYYELLGQGHTLRAIDAAWKEVNARSASGAGHSLLLLLGAVLVGVGILSFVASNWDVMSNTFRILIILVAMVGSYASGWGLMQRGHRATGHAFVLLGSCIYGAGIMLIGQMYHVHTNWTNAFNLWVIGVLAMAMYFRSLSHVVLSCALLFVSNITLATEMMENGLYREGAYAVTDGSWATIVILLVCAAVVWIAAWYLHKAATNARSGSQLHSPLAKRWMGRFTQLLYVFAVGQSAMAITQTLDMIGVGDVVNIRVVGALATITFFCVAYMIRGRVVLLFAILHLLMWWATAIIGPDVAARSVAVHGFVGMFFLALVALLVIGAAHRLLPKYQQFGSVYVGPTLVALLGFLTVISSSSVIMELWGNYGNRGSVLMSWSVTFTYFLLIAIVTGVLFLLSQTRRVVTATEIVWLAVLAVFALLVGTAGIAAVEGDSAGQFAQIYRSALTTGGIAWAFALNGVAFATMLWVVVVGYQRQDRWRVTTAALAICIWVLARYFDWIFTYLDKSVGFMTLGVVLLAVGYGLERGRKKIIASFTHEHNA